MAIPIGAIVKNKTGTLYLIETASKRKFPDALTLSALTLGSNGAGAPTLTDVALSAILDGPQFTSLAAFVGANPRVVTMVQRIVRSLIPKSGLKDLPGGMMTIAESAATLFADAISNPENWAAPVQGGSKEHPLPGGFSHAASQAITVLLNNLLKQLIGQEMNPVQQIGIDTTLDEVATEVDNADDGEAIPQKNDGDKEDVKEAGEKEAGDKETDDKEPSEKEPGDKEPEDKEPGEKEPGDKEPGDKEPGDKEPGDKEPGDKESGDKEPGDKEPGDKEPGDKEPGDKEPGDKEPGDKEPGDKEPGDKEPGDKEPGEKDDKDEKEDDGDGGDGGEEDLKNTEPAKEGSQVKVKRSSVAADSCIPVNEWNQFTA